MDPEVQLRVRLAALFGCPLWQVGQLVPASELPLWRVHFEQEPWGFRAMDRLASKTALQITAALGRIRPGTGVADLMFQDRFTSGDLTEAEFEELSPEEQNVYLERQIRKAMMVLN